MLFTGIVTAASLVVAWALALGPRLEITAIELSAETVGGDAVGLDVGVEVFGPPGADVLINGTLLTAAGTPITGQDSYFRSAIYMLPIEIGPDGTARGVFRFSGEAIRMAMVDGPWRVRLFGGDLLVAERETPAFAADGFGEQVGRLVHVDSMVFDDEVRIRMLVDVSERFEAHASAFIGAAGDTPWDGHTLAYTGWLEPGMREIVMVWDAGEVIAAGIEPPYSVLPSVGNVATLTSLQPRRATVPHELTADWHPVERRRREAGD